MSQISEYLQYQIQLRDTMLHQCSEKQNKKQQKKPIKNHYKCKIPKKTQDSNYKFYTKPSEFPPSKEQYSWRTIKFRGLFQALGKNDYFL